MNIGDQRTVGNTGPAGDPRLAGESGPAGDIRAAGQQNFTPTSKPQPKTKQEDSNTETHTEGT